MVVARLLGQGHRPASARRTWTHVEAVDDELGRLLDAVPDDTAVFVLGDHGLALGEHGYMGRGGAHLAPALLRGAVPDPAPERAEGRRPHRLVRVHARRGAHGAVVPRPRDPRQDGRRGPDRAVRRRRSVGPAEAREGDHRRRLADRHPRQPLARGRRPPADRAAHVRRRRGSGRRHAIKRYDNIAGKDTGQAQRAVAVRRTDRRRNAPGVRAGRSGAAASARTATTTPTTTASRTTSTRSTTSTRRTASTNKDLQFDGRYVEGGPLHPITIPKAARR